MVKFACDTYLIIPEMNSHTCVDEMAHVSTWAKSNNLTLNLGKSKEIIFKQQHQGDELFNSQIYTSQ